jgi:hypothetical protein
MADDSIDHIPSRDQWRALINVVMKLGLKLEFEDFFIAWVETLLDLDNNYDREIWVKLELAPTQNYVHVRSHM